MRGKWSWRYSENFTNREFKRKWFYNHKGSPLPPKNKRVYTLRPQGPGPLVKLEKHERRKATGWATAQEHKRVERAKMAPGAFGPLIPIRDNDGRKYIIPARREPVSLTRSKKISNEARLAAVGRISQEANQLIATRLGGCSYVLPEAHHKKYWYFLRKRGFYTFSTHHPYGDEKDLVLKRIKEFDSG